MITLYQTFGTTLAVLGVLAGLFVLMYVIGVETNDALNSPSKRQQIDAYLDRREAWFNDGMVGPDPLPYGRLSIPNHIEKRITLEQIARANAIRDRILEAREAQHWPMPKEPAIDDTLTYPSEEITQELPLPPQD